MKLLNIKNEKKLKSKLNNLFDYYVKNSNYAASLRENFIKNKNEIIQKVLRAL